MSVVWFGFSLTSVVSACGLVWFWFGFWIVSTFSLFLLLVLFEYLIFVSPSLFRSKASSCLRVKTSDVAVELPSKLQGLMYSADAQCRHMYGNRARHCSKYEVHENRKQC